MICGKAQGLVIKKNTARKPKEISYWRRQLREHFQKCEFCQKQNTRKH